MRNRLFICMAILLPFISHAQQPEKNNKGDDRIIYRVFDSLDDYLAKEIASRLPKDTVQAIIIDPVCELERDIIGKPNERIENIILFSIIYKSMGYHDSVIEKTNRYISIGDQLYPVYIFYVDDILGVGKKLANRIYSGGKIDMDWHIHNAHNFGVVADMARNQYYNFTLGSQEMKIPRGVKKGVPDKR